MTTEEKRFIIREIEAVKVTANGHRYLTCRTDLGRVAFWGSTSNQRNIRQIEQSSVPLGVQADAIPSRWAQHALWIPETARVRLLPSEGADRNRRQKPGQATGSDRAREEGQRHQGSGSPKTGVFDPYEILGVSKGAPLPSIRAAYRELIKQYHPDHVARLGKELRDLANRKTQEINRAYELLAGSKR